MEIYNNIDSKRVFHSLVWKLMERFCSQGINLLVQILLARLLFPSDFGKLAIIMAITNYAGLFVQSGLAVAIVQKKDLDEKDVNTLLTSSLVIALFIYVCIYLFSPSFSAYYQHEDLVWPLRVLALVLFLNGINSVQSALFSRDMKFKQIFLRSITAVPVAAVISISMAYRGMGIWALVAYTLLNTGLTVIIMALASNYKLKLEFYLSRAKELYSFSVKILLAALVSGFGDTLRTLMIGKKYTSSDLGFYDKGYTYSFYFTQILNASISGVLLPTFSRSQDRLDVLLSRSRKSVRLTSFVIFPALIIIIIVAHPLILMLLTEKWIPCVFFLQLFCLLRLPGCIANIDRQVYLSIGNSSINFRYEFFLLLANTIMLFITVPIGVKAVAVGFLITEIVGCVSLFVVSSRVYGYTIVMRLKDIWKPALNSVLLLLFSVLPIWNYGNAIIEIISKLLISLVLYIIIACLFKDQNLLDIKNIVINQINKK